MLCSEETAPRTIRRALIYALFIGFVAGVPAAKWLADAYAIDQYVKSDFGSQYWPDY